MFGDVCLLVLSSLPSTRFGNHFYRVRTEARSEGEMTAQRIFPSPTCSDEAEASCDRAALHLLDSFPASLIAFNVKLCVCICVLRLHPLRCVSRPPSISDHKL